jgi:hypothetical protein
MKAIACLLLSGMFVFAVVAESQREETPSVDIGRAVTLSRVPAECVFDGCPGIGWEYEPDEISSNSR